VRQGIKKTRNHIPQHQGTTTMSDAKSKPVDAEIMSSIERVQIDWVSPALRAPLKHANQIFTQMHENTVILTFMAIAPPIILGEPETWEGQIDLFGGTIPAECIAKIALTPQTCKSLIGIIGDKLQAYENEAKTNGTKK
jgi:hypothetical protein